MSPHYNTNDLDYSILIKFIEGQASREETAEVVAWLQASPGNQALYFQVKDIFDQQLAAKIPATAAEESWRQVAEKLSASPQPAPVRRLGWLKIAAAVAILLLAGGITTYLLTRTAPQPAPLAVVVARKTTVQTLLLPDSTRIWVKPGSSLKMRDTKDGSSREVWLEGSAYFEVVKKAAQPFTVHIPDMTITVLGTSFTVNDDPHHSMVMVNTGLIKATAFQQELLLHPGERGKIVDNKILADRINPQLYAAWKDGNYKFENTSVGEIKELLHANYGYEVEVLQPQKFKDTRISGRVLITDEVSLCEALSAMLEADVHKTGNRIIIQPK